ncbi:MAG: hypothetical protein FJ095_13860 [Deltaproteobacteria bacterium]|nr:hypothetical protein [Deltaproteobacteria bacterium]
MSAAYGCATEETTTFGEPSRVTTSSVAVTVAAASSSSGMVCKTVNACEVSWSEDIYGAILNSTKPGAGGCSASNCHEQPAGGLAVDPNDADAAYFALLNYSLPEVGPYVTPCEPAQSSILCNLKFAKGVTNELYSDLCREPMPKTGSGSPVFSPLTKQAYDHLVRWIQCGAPLN